MRASDRIREHVADALGEAYAGGLLSMDTLSERLDRAQVARSVRELDALVADLPSRPSSWQALRAALGLLPRGAPVGAPDAQADRAHQLLVKLPLSALSGEA